MKFFKLFMLLAAVMAAPAAIAAGDAGAGQEKSAPCAACHGQDGNSPSAEYPSLAGQGAPYLVKQLKEFKSGERENAIMMGMVANLSEQDMEDVAAYYAKQQAQTGQADPELVEKGERFYRGGDMENGIPACSGCHGPAGQGVDAAHFPALAGQHPEYLEAQLKAFRVVGREDLGDNLVGRENDPQAMMRTISAKMSDGQIQAVASFLSGLSPKESDADAE